MIESLFRIAVVCPVSVNGETGGAERFHQGLVAALNAKEGVQAYLVTASADESSWEAVLETMLRFHELDVSGYHAVISTKAPAYLLRHLNHVCYLQHTMRVFYDMWEEEFPNPSREHVRQRDLVQRLDTAALQRPHTRKVFVIGEEVRQRLLRYNGVDSEVLYQALVGEGFCCLPSEPYVFLPGRLHRWKRASLAIEAMQQVKRPLHLLISGTGEDEAPLRRLAQGDPRIRFLGHVSDEERVELYAHALAVAFLPIREDFGLVTLEAFASGKPVLTCTDSGEPARIVRNEATGFVCDPDPLSIAARLEFFYDHPDLAAQMGKLGRQREREFSWDAVAKRLLAVVREGPAVGTVRSRSAEAPSHLMMEDDRPLAARTYAVTVLDMQPIDPPVGGGRLRLLGLYHGLGKESPTTYIGTYDWPGEAYRELQHSETLREITVPLSASHFAAAERIRGEAGGKTVIDATFHTLGSLSVEYCERAREAAANAGIVVFSHPWVYPVVQERLHRDRQLIVYDAQNVEGSLRADLLDGTLRGREIAAEVALLEEKLCDAAHLVLACSQEDRLLFNQRYHVPMEKIRVVPNGVFTRPTAPLPAERMREQKQALGLGSGLVAVFFGSEYPPNVEAAQFIANECAPALPGVTFIVGGGVSAALDAAKIRACGIDNVLLTGRVSEERKQALLRASDLAINPMFSGSGTNVKMFDFMAAGLPIVATPAGARGIDQATFRAIDVAGRDGFIASVSSLMRDESRRARMAKDARALAENFYSWERISAQLGTLLRKHRRALGKPRPFFSVIVPAYERPESLSLLCEHLERQVWKDFEVIVVDQSARPWPERGRRWNLALEYIQTDVRGAVSARNVGAFHARGDILAFTDDDCLPTSNWLERAANHFQTTDSIGIEGMVVPEHEPKANDRVVTNVGFEGIGFMTANLFLRIDVFNRIDGFDLRFDHPHFREDTDLAWRALGFGKIPFCRDVVVHHPVHARSIERESLAERNRYFEKDPLLLSKHPERYQELFLKEGHYATTDGFWEHFKRGAEKYGVQVPPFYVEMMSVRTRHS
jgi:glycosyltransferase involved in cell wall biosynthesis